MLGGVRGGKAFGVSEVENRFARVTEKDAGVVGGKKPGLPQGCPPGGSPPSGEDNITGEVF